MNTILKNNCVNTIIGRPHTGKTILGFRLFMKNLIDNPMQELNKVRIIVTESSTNLFLGIIQDVLNVHSYRDIADKMRELGYQLTVTNKSQGTNKDFISFIKEYHKDTQHIYIEEALTIESMQGGSGFMAEIAKTVKGITMCDMTLHGAAGQLENSILSKACVILETTTPLSNHIPTATVIKGYDKDIGKTMKSGSTGIIISDAVKRK